MPNLINNQTNETIRTATPDELAASIDAAQYDGGSGIIEIDGQSCYVDHDSQAQAESFRDACLDSNTVDELAEGILTGPDSSDMVIWGITESQWLWAISDALRTKLEEG
jgi:hypothetical protein